MYTRKLVKKRGVSDVKMEKVVGFFKTFCGPYPDECENETADREVQIVELDQKRHGTELKIDGTGRRISGRGAILASDAIKQDKAFFEIKIVSKGEWGVGLSTRKIDYDDVPLGKKKDSWVVRHDGKLYHNNECQGNMPKVPQEKDILGVSYDHVELNFTLNGKPLHFPFTGMRGKLYPAFYVADGAALEIEFKRFQHVTPRGFDPIMIEQPLLDVSGEPEMADALEHFVGDISGYTTASED